MEQFNELVHKKGVVSALREEAAAALSNPKEAIDSIKKPVAEAILTTGALYLAHRFGPAAVEKGAEIVRPIARELGASFDFDAFSHAGFRPALAGGVRLGEHSALSSKYADRGLKSSADEFLNKPIEMTSAGGTGGGGGGNANLRSWINSAGEREHSFENVQVGDAFNLFPHADGSKVYFGQKGKLLMQFPGSAETRMLDLGKPISSVQIKENGSGINEYRFNGETSMSMMINPKNHDIIGYAANGDRTYVADNVSKGLVFTHSRGGVMKVSSDGNVVLESPSGEQKSTKVGQPFKQAYFTEHLDGSASLRFSAQDGSIITGEISAEPSLMMAPPPERNVRPNTMTPQQVSNWRSPLQRNSPVHPGQSSGVDFFRYDASAPHHHDRWNIWPTSPERAIDARIAGVSGRVVADNPLTAPADMFTAQMFNNDPFLARFFTNLDKPKR